MLSTNPFYVGLMGAAIGCGQTKPGLERAPALIRESGFVSLIKKHSCLLVDYGDVLEEPEAHSSYIYKKIYEGALRMAHACDFNIFLGGDHSLSMATISALLKSTPDLRVVWVDAHGDMNTPKTSPTGSLHGMPLAALMGLFKIVDKFPEYKSWFQQELKPERLAMIGVRDLDLGEREFIKKYKISVFTTKDVKKMGAKNVTQQALANISATGAEPIHLSFDLDSIDPEYASATGVPVKNGLTPLQAIDTVDVIARTGRLQSMELVELNPLESNSPFSLSMSLQIFKDILTTTLNHVAPMPQKPNLDEVLLTPISDTNKVAPYVLEDLPYLPMGF